MNTMAVSTTDPFKKFVWWSIVGHIGLVLFFSIRGYIYDDEPLQLRKAIRVDIVGLPDKLLEMPAPMDKPLPQKVDKAKPVAEPQKEPPKVAIEKPKPKPKSEDAKAPADKKAEQKAFERLKSLQAIDKIKKLNQIEDSVESAPKPTPVKGTEISRGDSLTGLSQIQYDDYIRKLKAQTADNFDQPKWLAHLNLKAKVMVKIDEDGSVIERKVHTSSGNDIFDGITLSAVDRSAPFPEPPDKIKSVLKNKGIIFNFPE